MDIAGLCRRSRHGRAGVPRLCRKPIAASWPGCSPRRATAQKLFEAIAALRADRRPDHPNHVLRRASSMPENTLDPARAKFYGDAQEKITAASTDLLFFQLELNRLDDSALEAAMAQAPLDALPPVDRGPAQGKALPARRPHRAVVPRKIRHRPRRLEPPVRRNHRRAALQHRWRGADARAGAEPVAGPRPGPARSRGQRDRRRRSRKTCAFSR